MKYDLIVFDMDGTILDTLEDLKNSMNHTLRLHNMPERTLDEIRSFVGNGIRKLIERAVVSGTANEKISSCIFVYNRCDVYDGVWRKRHV